MRKAFFITLVLLFSSCLLSPAYAITITFDYKWDGGIPTTNQQDAIVWDFDNEDLSDRPDIFDSIEAQTAAIVSGSLSGKYAAPSGDTTAYLTVPEMNDRDHSGYIKVDLATSADYFGLYWGSIDDYNKIEFFDGGNLVAAYTGNSSEFANYYHQSKYVNFFFDNGQSFDSFKLSSTQFAYEVDNIAVKPIPEPSTIVLMIAGLLGLIGFRKKIIR